MKRRGKKKVYEGEELSDIGDFREME